MKTNRLDYKREGGGKLHKFYEIMRHIKLQAGKVDDSECERKRLLLLAILENLRKSKT